MQPFGHNRHGPKIGGLCPFGGGGPGSPSNTMWPGPRPCCMSSFILIRLTVGTWTFRAQDLSFPRTNCPYGELSLKKSSREFSFPGTFVPGHFRSRFPGNFRSLDLSFRGGLHNTAQNSSDNLPCYPPDNHHCSDDVCWRRGRGRNK